MIPRIRVSGTQILTGAVVAAVLAALAIPAIVDHQRRRASRAPSSKRPAAAHASSVFRFYQENPTTLDPALASDSYSSSVVAQIYSPLVGLTSELEPTPQV